jgi:hypothetical protein
VQVVWGLPGTRERNLDCAAEPYGALLDCSIAAWYGRYTTNAAQFSLLERHWFSLDTLAVGGMMKEAKLSHLIAFWVVVFTMMAVGTWFWW